MSSAPRSCAQGKDYSLTQILYIGRANSYNQVKEVTTANCKAKVLEVRKDHPWFSYTCALRNCQKGVIKAGDVYWCNSCEEISPHVVPSFRLLVDVTDGISKVTVAFLDLLGDSLVQRTVHDVLAELGECADPYAPPENLLHCCNKYQVLVPSSHTYIDHRSHENFTCGGILTHLVNVQVSTMTKSLLFIFVAYWIQLNNFFTLHLGNIASPTLLTSTMPSIDKDLKQQAAPSGEGNTDD